MANNILLVLGGAWHDFDEFEATLSPILRNEGYNLEATRDHTCFAELHNSSIDAVLLYTSLGNTFDGKRHGKDLKPGQTKALRQWVRNGKGLLGVHGASISAKENRSYRELIGGRFEKHPKPFEFTLYPFHTRNQFTKGIAPFAVADEFYLHNSNTDVEICLGALYKDEVHPMAWSRQEGSGHVAYLSPGHFPAVWNNEIWQTILLRMLAWCTATKSTAQAGTKTE
ncbi:MAG: hypothetical protein GF398_00145 [Chitinivibrionales bacterium]|nr:hypothetical protein [Chitinivibrionales bacterium]